MKRRLLHITTGIAVVMILISVLFVSLLSKADGKVDNGEKILALNEINQLTKQAIDGKVSYESVQENIVQLQEALRNQNTETQSKESLKIIFVFTVICIFFLYGIFYYIYHSILRPFDRMKAYANEIASGNFELPLDYERSNYFGAFTWAFDQMRCEIIKSRSCEKEAIENNKTVIATLSHDIKTPIASIRAYAEGLEANLDTSVEKRTRFTKVIMKKCDEVAALTNDLFLHSLSDLDKLQVTLEETDIMQLLSNTINDLSADNHDIRLILSDKTITAMLDPKRFTQIIENLITNARKYAKTKILVTTHLTSEELNICIRDYGPGIPDEDMPFIFEKFYRGHNKGDEPGSGLGLYITRYLLTQMNSSILLHNMSDGLEIKLFFPIHNLLSIS
ncbi:MAG: HAMP domain-containing sensor histidine kinase [Clostridiales bacterium]|nr:HAMP domain-containing sensor histidine kinase [Clostridiales bacterium]